MLPLAFLFLALHLAQCQFTPSLIARDAYTPPLVYCTEADVFTPGRISQCDIARSDSCDTDTFRCVLAASLSGTNSTPGAQLITFTVVTYAEIMPGYSDGKMQVTLSYTNTNFFPLFGQVQLWMFDPSTANSYMFTGQQYELNFLTGTSFLFHYLAAGTYVFVYWDVGGTRYGQGQPEISQPITLIQVFPAGLPSMFSISAMPLDLYNTNYQRSNHNFISYQLNGPLGYISIFTTACTDPRYNRCIFWEERTDQGNIKNAKTYLDPNFPVVAGVADTMFKYKTFPVMCCDRFTRITARLVYGNTAPGVSLFPTKYQDYWDQRQNYGYGTDIAWKILQLGLTYYDETFGCGGAVCHYHWVYQALVSANYGGPMQDQYPACTADSPMLNTLSAVDANNDMFMTNTLRRDYCECYTHSTCAPPQQTAYAARAFRAGRQIYTNNYDRYEDWLMPADDNFQDMLFGDFFGHVFSFDFSFQPHTNAAGDAVDYSCSPTNTLYEQTQPFNPNGLLTFSQSINPSGVFADILVNKQEMQDFYNYGPNYAGSDWCNTNNAGPVGFASCSIADYTQVGTDWMAAFAGRCNCQNIAGMFFRDSPTGPCPAASPTQLNPFIDGCYQAINAWSWNHNYPLYAAQMCCNYAAEPLQAINYYMTYQFQLGFGAGGSSNVMCNFVTLEWQGNILAEMYQVAHPGHTSFQVTVISGFPGTNDLVYYTPFNIMYCTISVPPRGNCFADNGAGTTVQSARYSGVTFITNTDSDNHIANLLTAPTGSNTACATTAGASTAVEFVYNPTNGDSTLGTKTFGTYGLDTFPITYTFRMSYDWLPSGVTDATFYVVYNYFPAYSRFKVIPTIEFLGFSNIDFGSGISPQPTIYVTFRVSCPNLDMDPSNNGNVGEVGYCAQTWFVTNQAKANIYLGLVAGPGTVSEPQSSLPPPFNSMRSLPDVYTSAVLTAKILYNDGDNINWYFFPKTEPEQPVGASFCGIAPGFSGTMQSPLTMTVPAQSLHMLPMISAIRSVPAACPYNFPEMLLANFRGEGYVYGVDIAQNLNSYDIVGNPLDYPVGVNYWITWSFPNGSNLEGFSVYFLPYQAGAVATVYDQEQVITGLTPGPPMLTPANKNPTVRQPSCMDDDTTATCLMTNDDTEDPNYTRLVPYHYCAAGKNQMILKPVLVFYGNFTFQDQVGALYCNLTTANIDVFIQEQQTKALFGITTECNITMTGYWTYTMRYGKSVIGLASSDTFPCYERFITYAILLTSFQPDPQKLIRIPNCTRSDNCCFQLPFNVMGNTGDSEEIINLATQCNSTQNLECLYVISTSPNLTLPELGLCPGETYSFTFMSPPNLVANRVGPTIGNFFQYPWRCPTTVTITLPTEGFSPFGIVVTNGNCGVEGSFFEVTVTFTEPTCFGPITLANVNPDCRFNYYIALAAACCGTVNPPPAPNIYGGGGNSPTRGFLLTGSNAPSFNVPYVFRYPQVIPFPSGTYESVPDGVYNLYAWAASPSANQQFDPTVAADSTKGVMTEVIAQFESANGLSIIINSIVYPTCPATSVIVPVTNATAIAITFTIIDQNWNGPYNVTFQAPGGQFITNYTVGIHDAAACGQTCSTLLSNLTSCTACNIKIRITGITGTVYIGTGISSINQQGLYKIAVNAIGTECFATQFPYIVPLNTLTAQVDCHPNTCSNRRDGFIDGYAFGGTLIPILLTDLIQNSDLTVAVARYNYYWNYTFLVNGTNVTITYFDVISIPFAGEGFYQLTVMDYNNCTVYASCEQTPLTAQIELELISSVAPNCSSQQGEITVAVVNNTGTPPFTLYKVGVDKEPVATANGYILSDLTVTPGQDFFYMVCDANECCSPMLNLSIAAATGFNVRLEILQIPCSTTSATGIITVHIVDDQNNPYAGNQPTFKWFLNGVYRMDVGNGPTIMGVTSGVWMVMAENINGCTSSASIALFTATSLGFQAERTPVTTENGIIQGTIFGGNGPPYSLTVQPTSNPPSPPDIGNIVIITIVQRNPITDNPPFTSFRISMVPPQANIFITVTDVAGCVFRDESRGGKIPVTIPPTPSQSPSHNYLYPKHIEDRSGVIAAVVSIITFCMVMFTCCFFCMEYNRQDRERRDKERYEQTE